MTRPVAPGSPVSRARCKASRRSGVERSEEHTSELQSPCNLVCRLLLEKKNKRTYKTCKQKYEIKCISIVGPAILAFRHQTPWKDGYNETRSERLILRPCSLITSTSLVHM